MDKYELRELHKEDFERILPLFKQRYTGAVESILTSYYMWKNFYRTSYLLFDDALIWLLEVDGEIGTQAPVCSKDKLQHYFLQAQEYFNDVLGQKMTLYLCDGEAVKLLDLDPDKYEVIPDRRYFDYIYDAQKIMTYSGKAYHKKKNHVNAFLKEYADRYEYRSMHCVSHYYEIMEFLYKWEELRGIEDEYDRVNAELRGIDYLISNCNYINFRMGGIYIDGELQAFTLGVYAKAEKMAYIHVEKANPNIRGLYPFIFQQFLLHECPDALYVNREDDMGLEGLRKSKMSYNPIRLVEKYEIRQL